MQELFSHLKLWIAAVRYNFKWLKIKSINIITYGHFESTWQNFLSFIRTCVRSFYNTFYIC